LFISETEFCEVANVPLWVLLEMN